MKAVRLQKNHHRIALLSIGLMLVSGVLSAKTFSAATARAQLAKKGVSLKGGHRKLELANRFAFPEQVVLYYVERDAAGFVWSGLMDLERRAFTAWTEIPKSDTFFVAENFQISKATYEGLIERQAKVKVKYEMLAIADANGTRMPPKSKKLEREFVLKQFGAHWKIVSPEPNHLTPVVVESKFPYGYF